MKTLLIVLTLAELAILVVVLAVYLIAIAATLRKISKTLGLVTFGVRAIEKQTEPIGPVARDINGVSPCCSVGSPIAGKRRFNEWKCRAPAADGDGGQSAGNEWRQFRSDPRRRPLEPISLAAVCANLIDDGAAATCVLQLPGKCVTPRTRRIGDEDCRLARS